ncbi:MAG: hypothetical protein V7L13_03935 [Nostoc sp.]|uniref:hypothetical protein n=1 Tax=Nostoc sp. TaxID=1180 RepID=UPI002FF65840
MGCTSRCAIHRFEGSDRPVDGSIRYRLGSGRAGNIFVNGDSLLVSNGAGLSSVSRSIGDSGQVVETQCHLGNPIY